MRHLWPFTRRIVHNGLLRFGKEEREGRGLAQSKAKRMYCLAQALACVRHSMVVVPLYDTLGPDAASYILSHTGTKFGIFELDLHHSNSNPFISYNSSNSF